MITSAAPKYIASTRLKIISVCSVSERSVWARNVRSVMVIKDTSAVFLRSSIRRLPAGGSMAGIAWGRTTRASVCQGVKLNAAAASRWPRGTARMAPRTTSAPYAPVFRARTKIPTAMAGRFKPKRGSTK